MLVLAAVTTLCCSTAGPQGQDPQPATCKFRVNDVGVLVEVPPTGFHNVDGPTAWLRPGAADWYGLQFVDASGQIRASASGLLPDWAGRVPVRPLPVVATPNRIVGRARIGALEIETRYRFDPEGPRVLVTFALVNRGVDTLHEVFVTREWQVRDGAGFSFPDDWSAAVGPTPKDIARQIWMFDDLSPGATTGATFAMRWEPRVHPQDLPPDVPLVQWTNPTFPGGLVFGATNGISWGDYDRDGWIDIFCLQSARLWRNLGGTDWQLVGDFDEPPTQLMVPTTRRYGSSFGDYDNDGLPDLATEPRGSGADTCFHLLQNLGGGPNFAEVASPAATIISEPCMLDAETAGWADVDDDGDLDLFLPVYPPWVTTAGNFFWTNAGPTGPGGAYRFDETSAASGLDNPPGSARPEGAQFCDIDFDGDVDLYSNGTLYQNKSTPALVDFDAMTEVACGIGLSTALDEGAMFFDYDLDGDYDLFVVYTSQGVRIWENLGDGTFFGAETSIVASPLIGLNLGMSAEDWDNDGDIDFTTRQVFRRNMLMETGLRQFTVATHTIPATFLTSATPAWGDWDRDGDLDCALGNWLSVGNFFQNDTYGPTTPSAARRYVRVKPLRDSAAVPAGLETEFGASVEIRVAGETDRRRKKFTASGHGYLNQNEYTLHFALPADPAPGGPNTDVRFDVVVDFPTASGAGLHRVDKHVNPALGAIDYASLANREIHVFRSGIVRINGCEIAPQPREAPRLRTSGGGLRLPTATVPNPPPTPAPSSDRFVGVYFDTLSASGFVRLSEIVLDGQLDAAVAGPYGDFNVALWDVTGSPVLAPGRTLALNTQPRNRRSFLPVNWLLPPGRAFRLVARITQMRSTSFAGPSLEGSLNILGGLNFQDTAPATGTAVGLAPFYPSSHYLAIRFRDAIVDQWIDLGGALPGSNGNTPQLLGAGALLPGSPVQFSLSNALPSTIAIFAQGLSIDCQPVLLGTLLPDNPILVSPVVTSALGAAGSTFVPAAVPPGATLAVQAWMLDPGNPSGFSASNTVFGASR